MAKAVLRKTSISGEEVLVLVFVRRVTPLPLVLLLLLLLLPLLPVLLWIFIYLRWKSFMHGESGDTIDDASRSDKENLLRRSILSTEVHPGRRGFCRTRSKTSAPPV